MMDSPNVIVIVVRGGTVQQVCAKTPEDVEVVLVDWDDMEAGDDGAHYLTPDRLRDLDPETARLVLDLTL